MESVHRCAFGFMALATLCLFVLFGYAQLNPPPRRSATPRAANETIGWFIHVSKPDGNGSAMVLHMIEGECQIITTCYGFFEDTPPGMWTLTPDQLLGDGTCESGECDTRDAPMGRFADFCQLERILGLNGRGKHVRTSLDLANAPGRPYVRRKGVMRIRCRE